MTWLEKYSDHTYALLRIVSGLLFSFHGMQKILGVFTDHRTPVGSQLWFGGLIELIAGLAIALGLFTSWVAILASGTMAVAYIQFHWKLQFGAAFWPAVNKGELAVVFCFVFLFMAARGGVKWCLDKTA